MNKNILFLLNLGSLLSLFILLILITLSLNFGIFNLYIFKVSIHFIFGFLINTILISMVLYGIFGTKIKQNLTNKIIQNDLKWFYKFVLIYFVLLFISNFGITTIHLDNGDQFFTLSLDNATFIFNGTIFDKIANTFGESAAFALGAQIGASFVLKKNISVPNKILVSLGTGSLSCQVKNANDIISTKMKNYLNNNNPVVNVNVDINGDSNSIVTSNLKEILPKFKNGDFIGSTSELSAKYQTFINNHLGDQVNIDTLESKVIAHIQNVKSQTISEIFESSEISIETNNTPTIINSPLELSEMDKLNDLKDIIELMGINLNISIILTYLLFSLIFVFSVKQLADSNINVDLLLKYPGGKIIHYILSKLLKVWSVNNTFWIYFILFITFLGSCFTAYSLYICSIVLHVLFKF
jgi:hypothetical protein